VRNFNVKSVSSQDADLFVRELMGDAAGAVPIAEKGFLGKFEKICFDGLSIGFVRSRGQVAVLRPAVRDSIFLLYSMPGTASFQVNCSRFDENSIAVIGVGGTLGLALPDPTNLAVLEIPLDQWCAGASHTANRDLLESLTQGSSVIQAPGGRQMLASAVNQVRRTVATRNAITADGEATARANTIIATAVKAVSARSNSVARPVASQHLINCYLQALLCVEARLPAGITVSDLCAETGIHERTLQMAFRTIADMTPGQYIRFRRLAACRRRLAAAYSDEETVSGLAMEYGFIYPSQFAAYYRKVFGEKPSVTLRRNPATQPSRVRERVIDMHGITGAHAQVSAQAR